MTEPVVLVFGSQGQVAQALVKLADDFPLHVEAAGRAVCDITSQEAVDAIVDKIRPQAIINAAAYTAVDQAEDDAENAQQLNAAAVMYLAQACSRHTIPLLHISTDYVFDGQSRRPYREEDKTSALGIYGATKLEGEKLAALHCDKTIILRTSWVFSATGQNFVKTMLRLFKEKDSLNVVDDQVGGPTAADAIATTLLQMTQQVLKETFNDYGVYHYCGDPAVTWCGFANAILERAAQQSRRVGAIKPVTSAEFPSKVTRPKYSLLDCSKLKRVFGIAPCDWQDALTQVVEEIEGINDGV
jgi:dTDP-4-dehydrorhamnose reductase